MPTLTQQSRKRKASECEKEHDEDDGGIANVPDVRDLEASSSRRSGMVTGQGAALHGTEPVQPRDQPESLMIEMQMRSEVLNDQAVLAITREVCEATDGLLRILARDDTLRVHKVSLPFLELIHFVVTNKLEEYSQHSGQSEGLWSTDPWLFIGWAICVATDAHVAATRARCV